MFQVGRMKFTRPLYRELWHDCRCKALQDFKQIVEEMLGAKYIVALYMLHYIIIIYYLLIYYNFNCIFSWTVYWGTLRVWTCFKIQFHLLSNIYLKCFSFMLNQFWSRRTKDEGAESHGQSKSCLWKGKKHISPEPWKVRVGDGRVFWGRYNVCMGR